MNIRSVLLTSRYEQEGKSEHRHERDAHAGGLTDKGVVLVDADLRCSSLARQVPLRRLPAGKR